MRSRGPAGQPRAGHVHGQGLLELAALDVADGAPHQDPRVVDQDVEAAEALHHRGHGRLDGAGVGGFHLDGQRLGAGGRGDFVRLGPRVTQAAAGHRHLCPGVAKGFGHDRAEAPGAARHQSGASVEAEQVERVGRWGLLAALRTDGLGPEPVRDPGAGQELWASS